MNSRGVVNVTAGILTNGDIMICVLCLLCTSLYVVTVDRVIDWEFAIYDLFYRPLSVVSCTIYRNMSI